MKKQALKAVTMLISIVALALTTALIAGAQSRGQKLRANVPFDFVVGDKTLAAGAYNVGQLTQDSSGIIVRSINGKQGVIRLTNTVQSPAPKNRGMLTFHRYGNRYFLASIWTAGSAEGRELLKSKSEREAERELARNPSSGELAQGVEIVTIFAELR